MRLYNYLTEGIHDKGIFKTVVMAGSVASGKSYIISKITAGSIEPRIVNTDKWTEFYMQFDPDFNWEKYEGKVKTLTKAQLTNYLDSMLPLWIDGTSSNANAVLRRKGILQSLGYDTALIFIDTPVETAIERNRQRDRYVDEDFLKKAYEKTQKLKEYYRSEFRQFTEILNGEGELIDKVIIDAYKKMASFFESPIENPIGRDLKEEMLEKGYKYLSEHPEYDRDYISKLVDNWYRK